MTNADDAFATLLKRLSARAYNALAREGWCDAQPLRKVDPSTLLDIRGFGVKSLAATVVALNETQGAALPEWVTDLCTERQDAPWWAPEYAAMREKLHAMDNRPHAIALQLAVIEAAKVWHKHGDITTRQELEEAVQKLIEFESEAKQ